MEIEQTNTLEILMVGDSVTEVEETVVIEKVVLETTPMYHVVSYRNRDELVQNGLDGFVEFNDAKIAARREVGKFRSWWSKDLEEIEEDLTAHGFRVTLLDVVKHEEVFSATVMPLDM